MMGKSMVSYRLSLTPIHWDTHLSPPRRFYFTDRNLSRDVTLREAASGAWLSGQWLLQCPKLQREGPERLGAVDGMLAWWYSKMPWESPTYEYCWFSIWSILIHFGLSVDFEFKMMMFRIFWDALSKLSTLISWSVQTWGIPRYGNFTGKYMAVHRNLKGLTNLFFGGKPGSTKLGKAETLLRKAWKTYIYE